MVAVTGVLAGCGTVATAGAGGTGKTISHAPAKVSLTVSLLNEGTPKHFRLTCQPVGGNAPDATSLCRALESIKKPFSPPLKRIMCPMIIVSDHQIVLSGTWHGQKVHRVVTDGGCDLGVFNTLDKVLH
jgi:Subtilisin inhibitor-like